MVLPTPPPVTNPIPNNPFYSPLNPYVCGPYFPIALGNGIDLTTGAKVPELVNQVQDVLVAGPGIALTTFLGVTTITSTGGGGGGGVTSVTGTAPIQVATGTTTPVISIDAALPTAIGAIAGYTDVTDTDFNTALGYCALNSGASAGFSNVSVGLAAGYALTTGSYGNTLIGPGTGCAISTGTVNTGLGIGALSSLTSGFANVGVGICSGCAYTVESGNAVLGGYAGDPGDTNSIILSDGAGNLKAKFDSLGALSFDGTAYGNAGEALLSNGAGAKPTWGAVTAAAATPTTLGTVCGCTPASYTALGSNAALARTTGIANVAVGVGALCAATTGSLHIAIGENALRSVTTINNNIGIGYRSLCAATTAALNTAIGNRTLNSLVTGGNNIAIGESAMRFATGSTSIAIGNSALCTNAGDFNIGLGNQAAMGLTTGICNTFLGGISGANIVAGSCNVFVGTCSGTATDVSCCLSINVDTLSWLTGDATGAIKPAKGVVDCANSCGTAGQVLMSDGANAICWGTAGGASAATPIAAGVVFACTIAASHTFLGNCAGAAGGGTSVNTGIGTNSLKVLTGGQFTVALGHEAMATTTATGSRNIAIGYRAANSASTNVGTSDNIFVGANSGAALGASSVGNIAIGSNGANAFATGSCNTVLGTSAGQALTSGSNNLIMGAGVQAASATGSCQLAIGFSSVENWLTGDSTKAIQPGAGIRDCAASTGTAGQVLMSNGANAICWGASPSPSAATPTVLGTVLGRTTVDNVALGCNAFLSNISNNNTAVGACAMQNTASGANTGVGSNALLANTSGTGNTALGAFSLYVNTTGRFNTALGRSAMISATTGCGNVVVGGFNSSGVNAPVFVVTTDNDRVGIGSTAVTNAYVQVAWTITSDARDKITRGEVPHGLDFVKQLEPKAFHFKKTRDSETPHGPLRYGFLAQEILALEGGKGVIIDAEDSEKLRYNGEALVPVLVNAIKELSAKVEVLEAKLAANG